MCEVVQGSVREREIDPLDLCIPRCSPSALAGDSPADNAQIVREVFAGANGPRRDAVLLNAAGAIAAAGHAADLREGLVIAAKTVDSGAAAARLEELVAFSVASSAARARQVSAERENDDDAGSS